MVKVVAGIVLSGLLLAGVPRAEEQRAAAYTADLPSLQKHTVPAWFENAKLGIFVHWGLYSVPGWAPLAHPDHDFANPDYIRDNPYAEWYYNVMRVPGSPTAQYHREHFGGGDYYATFTPLFNQATRGWDANTWAQIFKDAGARYAVLTTKHHEGFCLWPSAVPNPNQGNLHAERDLVGAFTGAMRKAGLRAGLYYSGGYDWTFNRGPIETDADYGTVQPQTHAYGVYADAQAEELTRLYHPDILWNDISWPKSGHALKVIADYYNAVPEGLVDDRWGIGYGDYGSPEYETRHEIDPKKFEATRGLGASFGYNRAEGERETLSAQALIDLFVDIVSKDGNLLLDVGPQADGTLTPVQLDRLRKLGAWLKVNGEAIYDTRPWTRAEGKTGDGGEVRFTQKAQFTYAVLLRRPTQATVVVKDLTLRPRSEAKLLGVAGTVPWQASGADTVFTLPPATAGDYALSLRVETMTGGVKR